MQIITDPQKQKEYLLNAVFELSWWGRHEACRRVKSDLYFLCDTPMMEIWEIDWWESLGKASFR